MSAQPVMAMVHQFAPREKAVPEIPEVVRGAQAVLGQGLDLLIRLSEQSYSRVLSAPFQASIGQHYRHVLEHFQCLTRGIKSREINFDSRERNPRIERELSYASVVTCEILRAIKPWTDQTLDGNCRVIERVSYDASRPAILHSTIGRELADCTGHAIHHFAIIRILCGELGMAVPPDFGYAPSTLRHRSEMAAD